jgi:hypothetical protein
LELEIFLTTLGTYYNAPERSSASANVHLPPDIPVANFWSLTLYEAENASGLDNGQDFPSLGSRDKPAPKEDGSTILYLSPKALRARNQIGYAPFLAEATLQFCGSMRQRKSRSTKPGNPAISKG